MEAESFPHAASVISQVNGEETGETLSAYSSSPETVFGAAYLAILPTHRLLHGNSSVRSALEKAFKPGRGELFVWRILHFISSNASLQMLWPLHCVWPLLMSVNCKNAAAKKRSNSMVWQQSWSALVCICLLITVGIISYWRMPVYWSSYESRLS